MNCKAKSVNVLSLFDGMSCGRIALDRANIPVEKYYASEIDKYATTVSEANYPDIIRMGDVTKWEDWDIDWSSIDLVLAGFPCQSWSLAGKQLGDKDERGMLFWVALDVISKVLEHNPNAKYLLENVKMKREFEGYITHHTEQALGEVHKTLINSSLLSAQNRQRYYWTNFPVSQPEDKGVVLSDIIEDGVVDRDKSYCIDANYYKGGNPSQYFNKSRRQLVFCGAMRGRYVVDGKRQDHKQLTAGLTKQRIEVRYDEKTNALTTVGKDNVVVYGADGTPHYDLSEITYRKLTPVECERLQTISDGYSAHVSNTQRYKMMGNAWTVDVIAHILRGLRDGIPHHDRK